MQCGVLMMKPEGSALDFIRDAFGDAVVFLFCFKKKERFETFLSLNQRVKGSSR